MERESHFVTAKNKIRFFRRKLLAIIVEDFPQRWNHWYCAFSRFRLRLPNVLPPNLLCNRQVRSVVIRPSESAQLAGTESGKRSRRAYCPRRLRKLLQHILNHVQRVGHALEFPFRSARLSVILSVDAPD